MSIRKVQEKLKAAGFDPGPADGKWGPRTEAALDAALALAQGGRGQSFEIVVGGGGTGGTGGGSLPAPLTPVKRLTAADIAEAAAQLEVTPAHVKAVLEVECRGEGLADDGRPIILFEPHVFSRETGGRFDASHPDLSYPQWGARPYPATQAARWDQLGRAIQLNPTSALRSASWGLAQIMGFNHAAAGHASIDGFVAAMYRSERAQLDAFVALLLGWNLDDALRDAKWSVFALKYNGPGYAKHGYHTKLTAAYARHAKADARAAVAQASA